MTPHRILILLLTFLVVLLCSIQTTHGFSLGRRRNKPTAYHSRLAVVGERGSVDLDKKITKEDIYNKEEIFFIRKCLPAEIRQASDVLTEVFFRENTNFISFQWERLTTYLSVESTYPKPGERHFLFVACHAKSGRVLGLAEIDDRPPLKRDPYATPRPYMYNVAVDPKWRRKGIAKALIRSCEEAAQEWDKPEVFLKVRDSAKPAIAMYESLGYVTRDKRLEKLNKKYQQLIVMSKKVEDATKELGNQA